MSRIEGEFVGLALELGLAETIAEVLRDVDRAIAAYPVTGRRKYLLRLQQQRHALLNPSLRTTSALIVSMAQKTPWRVSRIAPVFAQLAKLHPDLRPLHERFRQACEQADDETFWRLERGAA